MEEPPFPRDTSLGLCKRCAKGLLWLLCTSSKSSRVAPVCSKTGWVGWVYVPQAHHCIGEEEQHHQPHPQTGLRKQPACADPRVLQNEAVKGCEGHLGDDFSTEPKGEKGA